jgi:hypothetical protein
MLITLYEEDNSSRFSSKFTTPLILPKNATIQLLKAYIPRNHQITIDNTNNQISLLLHTKDTDVVEHFVLNNGNYGLQAFANELIRIFTENRNTDETNNSGQLRHFIFNVDVDTKDNNNAGADAITISVGANSHNLDFYYHMDFTDAGNLISSEADGNFEKAMDSGGTFTIAKGDGSLRCSHKHDGGGNAIAKWDNHAVIVRDLVRNCFGATTENNMKDDDVMRLAYPNQHTLISFKINNLVANGNSFWIGIRKSGTAIDTTGVVNNQLDQVPNITGFEACMVFYGTTANGKTAGTCEFFENVAGTITRVGGFTSARTTPLVQNDKFMMLIPLNDNGTTDPITYKLFKTGQASRYNPRMVGHRFIPSEADNYELCFGFYNDGATIPFTNLMCGMNAGYKTTADPPVKGVGKFDVFGKYAKLFLNGAGATANNGKNLKSTLGYAQDDYEEDKTAHGHEPVFLTQANEGDMITNDQKQPYLNVNINNLPVISYTCADPNASNIGLRNTQHNLSKCVASIPRFNADGSFDNGALIFDDNTQSIQLNNADECELSSLDIRLQNCDGTYPTDLRTPSSFVFKVSGDDLY